MIIEAVQVKNFRSILNATLRCEPLTALVGSNGAGKSSFLKALKLFYDSSPDIDEDDFYDGDTDKEIEITITFKNLTDEAKTLFAGYLQDNRLVVERIITWDNGRSSSKYHGATLQNLDFQPVREAFDLKDRAKTAKERYAELHRQPLYQSLPKWSNKQTVLNTLKSWEEDNPGLCIRQRDDGQFFGFKTVAQGYLGRFTQFLYIPAVRDASDDASEGRGSVLTQLMDLVVRSVLANNIALSQLKETVQEQYETIMAPANLTEINDLAQQMTQTLKTYVPGAGVQLDWSSEDINIPLPKANIKLVEDGYSSTVTRAGHGLQRAFILTMLQHLAAAQTNTNDEIITEGLGKQLPNFALVIEEPELYQHPNRQRHFAKVLWDLTTGSTPGVADQTQVIYGTHSPLFVGIDRIDQVRRLRKEVQEANKPKITKVIQTSLNKVAEEVWRIDGEPRNRYTAQTLLPRLQAIMTPWMSEGFFADVVILVEGEDDRAALLGMAKAMDVELEGRGFSVIPCGGKSNLDRPLLIFRELDIPVYVIWDGDFKKGEAAGICEKCGRRLDSRANPKDNHRLLRLVGWATPEEDWPEYIEEKFTCFKHDLETMLKNEIGSDLFESYLDECKNELSIPKRKHAIKNPNVLAYIIKNAQKQGCTSQTLEQTIDKILMLKS